MSSLITIRTRKLNNFPRLIRTNLDSHNSFRRNSVCRSKMKSWHLNQMGMMTMTVAMIHFRTPIKLTLHKASLIAPEAKGKLISWIWGEALHSCRASMDKGWVMWVAAWWTLILGRKAPKCALSDAAELNRAMVVVICRGWMTFLPRVASLGELMTMAKLKSSMMIPIAKPVTSYRILDLKLKLSNKHHNQPRILARVLLMPLMTINIRLLVPLTQANLFQLIVFSNKWVEMWYLIHIQIKAQKIKWRSLHQITIQIMSYPRIQMRI